MAEREPDFSRVGRKKERNQKNKILNGMIAVVVLLIVIATATIFSGSKDEKKAVEKEPTNIEETIDDTTTNANESENVEDSSKDNAGEDSNSAPPETDTTDETVTTNEGDSNGAGSLTYVPSDDDVIAETVIDTSWKPIGTTQTGVHVSLYDGDSADWNEKKQALAYATGLPQESMIFLKIKNGGDPQKSIGIVSSRDSVQKYRVYLEWVDGEGWKPVKMDKLTTLDFEY